MSNFFGIGAAQTLPPQAAAGSSVYMPQMTAVAADSGVASAGISMSYPQTGVITAARPSIFSPPNGLVQRHAQRAVEMAQTARRDVLSGILLHAPEVIHRLMLSAPVVAVGLDIILSGAFLIGGQTAWGAALGGQLSAVDGAVAVSGTLSPDLVRSLVPPDVSRDVGNAKQLNMEGGRASRYSPDVYWYEADAGSGLADFLYGRKTNLRGLIRSGKFQGAQGDGGRTVHIIYDGATPADIEAAGRFSSENGVDIRIYDVVLARVYDVSAGLAPSMTPLKLERFEDSKGNYQISRDGDELVINLFEPSRAIADIQAILRLAGNEGVRVVRVKFHSGEPDEGMYRMFADSRLDVRVIFTDANEHVHVWRSLRPDVRLQPTEMPSKSVALRLDGFSEQQRLDVEDFLAGHDFGRMTSEYRATLARYLLRHRKWDVNDVARLLGGEVRDILFIEGTGVPLGMSRAKWLEAQRAIFVDMHLDGMPGFRSAFMQGSAVDGVKSDGETPFRPESVPGRSGKTGKRSDFDFGVELSDEGFAIMLVDSIRSTMLERGIDAGFADAIQAALRWMDTIETDPARARNVENADSIARRAIAVGKFRSIVEKMAKDYEVERSDATRDRLEWWQEYHAGGVRTTERAKFLEKALGDQKIPYFLTGSAVQESAFDWMSRMRDEITDRPLDLSFRTGNSPKFPSPDRMFVMSGEHYVSGQ